MDRDREKRLRNIRVAITNIFMCTCVAVIVFVLTLVVMGFSFNERGELERAGLLRLASFPSGASIDIDGKRAFGHTDTNKQLSTGEHTVSITKDGYDTWESTVNIESGLLTRIEWIRLFPTNQEFTTVKKFENVRFAYPSDNHKLMLVAEKDSDKLFKINLQDENPEINEINLHECLSTTASEAVKGDITIASWNRDGNRFLLKWTKNGTTSWHFVDLEHSEQSINLNKQFNLSFSDIRAANDSASKLWAVENDNLHLIDINRLSISGDIATNVQTMASNREFVGYIRSETASENQPEGTVPYSVYIYKDGGSGDPVKIDLINQNTSFIPVIEMGNYWNDQWIAYSNNEQLIIKNGQYPSSNNDNNSLHTALERNIGFTPYKVSANTIGRAIVAIGENNLFSFDVESKNSRNTTLEITPNISWLDGYLLWENIDDTILVRDFDGSNRRTIIKSDASRNLPAVISENNHWLFYFDSNNNLKHEKLF